MSDGNRNTLFRFPRVFVFDGSNNTISTSGGDFTITEGSYTTSELNTELSNGDGVYWSSFEYTSGHFEIDPIETIHRSSSAIDHFNFPGSSDISSDLVGEPIRSYPFTYIDIDLKVIQPIEFIAIIGNIREAIDIDPSSTITLEGNNFGGYGNGQWSEVIEYNAETIFKSLVGKGLEARYLRLKIASPASNDRPFIGQLYIGEAQQMPNNRNFGNAFGLDYENLTETRQTESNQYFFNSRPYRRVLSGLGVTTAKKDVSKFIKDTFLNNGVEKPFFLSLDPSSEVHEEAQEVTFFARFQETPSIAHVIQQYYDFDVTIEEVF